MTEQKSKVLFTFHSKKKKRFCASAMVSVCEDKKNLEKSHKDICNFLQLTLF